MQNHEAVILRMRRTEMLEKTSPDVIEGIERWLSPWIWLPLAILIGLALLLAYLYSLRDIVDQDEALIGLMARQVPRGEWPTFFYGQAYNGSLEPLLIAPFFKFLGSGIATLCTAALILSMPFPFLLWEMCRRMFGDLEGRFALVLALIGPVALTGMSLMSWGNYVEILVISPWSFFLLTRSHFLPQP